MPHHAVMESLFTALTLAPTLAPTAAPTAAPTPTTGGSTTAAGWTALGVSGLVFVTVLAFHGPRAGAYTGLNSQRLTVTQSPLCPTP